MNERTIILGMNRIGVSNFLLLVIFTLRVKKVSLQIDAEIRLPEWMNKWMNGKKFESSPAIRFYYTVFFFRQIFCFRLLSVCISFWDIIARILKFLFYLRVCLCWTAIWANICLIIFETFRRDNRILWACVPFQLTEAYPVPHHRLITVRYLQTQHTNTAHKYMYYVYT